MTGRRRITIITISVFLGTLLSVLLVISRKGKVDSNDKLMLVTNFVFGLLIVIAISYFMNKLNKKDQAENQKK